MATSNLVAQQAQDMGHARRPRVGQPQTAGCPPAPPMAPSAMALSTSVPGDAAIHQHRHGAATACTTGRGDGGGGTGIEVRPPVGHDEACRAHRHGLARVGGCTPWSKTGRRVMDWEPGDVVPGGGMVQQAVRNRPLPGRLGPSCGAGGACRPARFTGPTPGRQRKLRTAFRSRMPLVGRPP